MAGTGGSRLAYTADLCPVGAAIDGVDGTARRMRLTDTAVTWFWTGFEGLRDYHAGRPAVADAEGRGSGCGTTVGTLRLKESRQPKRVGAEQCDRRYRTPAAPPGEAGPPRGRCRGCGVVTCAYCQPYCQPFSDPLGPVWDLVFLNRYGVFEVLGQS